MSSDDTCRKCGAELHPNSRSCRKCGSSRASLVSSNQKGGASEGSPDDFDYESFIEREFQTRPRFKPPGLSTFWWITAILVLISFLYLVFVRGF